MPNIGRKGWVLTTVGVVLLSIPVVAKLAARAYSANRLATQRYGHVPTFSLKDQLGRVLRSEDLDGKVWVGSFMFTSCAEACPRISQELAKIQRYVQNRGADGQVRLVSFSVDPERDTPERLNAYAKGFEANPQLWRFVTGSAADIQAAVVQGFKQAIERQPPKPPGNDPPGEFDILHGTYVVLVDQKGDIRGYYDAHDFRRMADLREDLNWLLRKGS